MSQTKQARPREMKHRTQGRAGNSRAGVHAQSLSLWNAHSHALPTRPRCLTRPRPSRQQDPVQGLALHRQTPARCPIHRGCAQAPPPQEGPLRAPGIQWHKTAYPRQTLRQLRGRVRGGASGADQGARGLCAHRSQPAVGTQQHKPHHTSARS